ncbi:MAG: hypothetical protein V1841_01945 [Patescibacteria group bacterium]
MNSLPIGFGRGVLITKNGKEITIGKGRVVEMGRGRKMLQSLKKHSLKRVKETFAGFTGVSSWRQLSSCANCIVRPNCNGNCSELAKIPRKIAF